MSHAIAREQHLLPVDISLANCTTRNVRNGPVIIGPTYKFVNVDILAGYLHWTYV